jgi:hypothetical protein
MIQQKLLAGCTVVDDAMARTVDADQKLLRLAVSMLAPNVLALYVENQEITFDFERNVLACFTEAEQPAQILDQREVVNGYSLH